MLYFGGIERKELFYQELRQLTDASKGVIAVPLFMARKEVFKWLKEGVKTIDVRKGTPRKGDVAVFQSGVAHLEFPIVKKETGELTEVITQENFRSIVPKARNLKDAFDYLQAIYGTEDGVFTAYHLGLRKVQ